MSIIIFIIILGILIFVHEFGHFVVAKLFGIRVDEFGMGFPPRAIRLFKRGETEYTLNWIPFGGFVKIYGEDSLKEGERDPDWKRSIGAKKWWQQILVLIAGVTMNVILAWIIFTGSLLVGAPTLASQADHPELLKDPALTVLEVAANSPAEHAGFMAGDRIVKAASAHAILSNASPEGFTSYIQGAQPDEPVTIEIKRGKEVKDIVVVPTVGAGSEAGKPAIGVSIDVVGTSQGLGFFQAIKQGAITTYYSATGTFKAFGQLISGKVSLNTLSGPVGLTKMVGEAQKIGFMYVFILMAIISLNLAVINILPFPALDGGRILFVIIEKIIRRPLPQKFVEWANGIGFVLLIGLMLVITVKDVIKLF